MRIVVDLQACQTASRARGIGRYALAFVDALLRNRGSREILLMLNAAHPDSVESLRSRFSAVVGADHVVVFDTPLPVAEHDSANDWRARASEHIREGFLASLAPDVVLVSSLCEGFVDDATTAIRSASSWTSAAVLYDLIPLFRPETLPGAASRRWYDRKLESLRRADVLLAISGHARAEAMSGLGLPAERVSVISAAADGCFAAAAHDARPPQRLLLHWGIRRPFVLYVGGFDERKNVAGLVAAYAGLPASVRDHHQLVLAGWMDDDARRQLLRLCAAQGLRDREVVLTGYLDDNEMAAFYRSCSAFVFPSFHEGFGLPVLEAMSSGAPVIASRATSIPELVGRDDALFDPMDSGDIGQLLAKVLTAPAFRESLRSHGTERATGYSWDRTATLALEALDQAVAGTKGASPQADSRSGAAAVAPRLAYVSPLPPERTGVAGYSAELLGPLARHYRIELVTDQSAVDLPDAIARMPVRSTEWFESNGDAFDRVLYQIGNSPFHCRMFELMKRHPGTAVLHDFYLGSVANWMDASGTAPGALSRWLFESHGYPALVALAAEGAAAVADRYPCNWPVVSRAAGIIVHSTAALDMARHWYNSPEHEWRRINQVHALPRLQQRESARAAIGVAPDEILICSFGFLDSTKLSHRLLAAWLGSGLVANPKCRLVFVGENHGGAFGAGIAQAIAGSLASNRIRITGFVDAVAYEHYLNAADVAVQLRGVTRGETSRAVLDCLAHGLPLIVNATGALTELPDGVTLRLDAEFADEDLVAALERLAADASLRRAMGATARQHVSAWHDPDRVAEQFRDAIEDFARRSRISDYRRAVASIASLNADVRPKSRDWARVAESLALVLPRSAPQLLVDVTVIAKQDLNSGIERVVRNVLRRLLRAPPHGYRVEPVRAQGGGYVYAREFTCRWLGLSGSPADDDPIDVSGGDVFLGLDWPADIVPGLEPAFQRYRTLGLTVTFFVYDLLPLKHPEFFPVEMTDLVAAWLRTIASVADGILCVSNAVADDLLEWLRKSDVMRQVPLNIGTFRLGADLDHRPVAICGDGATTRVEQMGLRPSVLMVGTIEPRKGHEQAFAAFELLWNAGFDANLVVVGRHGWMMDDLARRLRGHGERGRRLLWCEEADDALLERIYAMATVLLAPSRGEGFGLPLIEAARHGLPLIARDLSVFREVAGAHASYFKGESAEELASAIRGWFALRDRGQVPDSAGITWWSWDESTKALLDVVLDGQWRSTWVPPDEPASAASGARAVTIDFSRPAMPRAVQSISGLSGREPWGRWSDARTHPWIEIRFRSPLPRRGSLSLTAKAFGPNVGEPTRIRLGSHETSLRFAAHDTTVVIDYESDTGPTLLEIVPPHPTAPTQLGLSADVRQLAIGLVQLTISAS